MTGDHQNANPPDRPQAIMQLITDAELVADVAVRLGRLKNLQLLNDIAALRHAMETGADCTDPIVVLQTSLNAAVKEIDPITLRDLRAGWSPFSTKAKGASILSFGVFAILLICITAYATSFYNRMVFAHTSLIEIQTARVSEQVMKFYDLLRYNQKGMIQAFKGGSTRDVIIENFYKSYFDLKTTDEKLAVMVKESLALTTESPFTNVFGRMSTWFTGPASNERDADLEANLKKVQEWQSGYAAQTYGGVMPAPEQKQTTQADPNNPSSETVDTLLEALRVFFFNAAAFIAEARLTSMNPVKPIPIYETILRLHEAMNTFGTWYLPALYGMLGSTVFHMRRFLDPNSPNPSSIRTAYRIFLGAFAGIVVVWFWAPSPKSGEPVVSALSSFSVAFLVGFSIDIFFQALDRLVTKVAQAIG